MRGTLIFWLIIFILGVLVGERYGLPSGLTGITDRGFDAVEGMIFNRGASDDQDDQGADTDDQYAGPGSASLGSNEGLRINDAGLNIIKESEGLRLEAYQLGGGWYIGYGHAGASPGQKITAAEADQLLREDVRDAEDGVKAAVTVPMNVNQFSAMVSLAYNLGVGGFRNTTVLTRINKRDYKGAADGFLNHNKAGGKVLDHLTERREKERALFLTPA